MPLGEGVLITEVTTPPSFVGQTLADLSLPRRYGITLVAIRRSSSGAVIMPGPELKLEDGDVMVIYLTTAWQRRRLGSGADWFSVFPVQPVRRCPLSKAFCAAVGGAL